VKVAFGLKAHSGWAALVVAGRRDGHPEIVDRRRLELVEEEWAKQPYHAAENLEKAAARELVGRGVAAAHRIAARELRAALKRERERGNEVVAGAVLVGNPLPDWSVDEILAVHLRMHAAEGFLFRDALARAVGGCQAKLVALPEKDLTSRAVKALDMSEPAFRKELAVLGKSVGPPWGRDQKDAALAALVALQTK
jgi:hypothetical protein